MKLLIVTQAVDQNDPALAFFHTWIQEFSKKAERVEVICLKEGTHALAANVRVHSLGKENGKRSRFLYAWHFLRLVYELRGSYEAVLVHMNPEYVILAGAFWRMWGKKVVLWYTHRQVSIRLRCAAALAHVVATAAPESLRLRTSKARVLGHGIDTNMFDRPRQSSFHTPARIISVGRITPIKRLDILVDALAILSNENVPVVLSLVGTATVPSDRVYEASLKAQVDRHHLQNHVFFEGAITYAQMPARYATSDISVNLAPTGGIDKAVLESMAAGVVVIVANRAFAGLLGQDADFLLVDPSPSAIAHTLKRVLALSSEERIALQQRLVNNVRTYADVQGVVERLFQLLL